jgi:hypothetical protein
MSNDPVIAEFCECAELIINEGLRRARSDDPHRFNTLHTEFDQGKARRQLAVDYLAGGHLRIALVLIGMSGGEEKIVQLFETIVQGPPATGATH